MESLTSHSEFFKDSVLCKSEPTEDEKNTILFCMEKAYDVVRCDMINWFSYKNFRAVLGLLEKSSSPGYGFSRDSPTIGEWLGFDGVDYNENRVSILWSRVLFLYNEPNIDALWKVFIKREPHKITKMNSKRWRLIQCCPLDVQVLWHLVFAKQNEMEIVHVLEIPSVQGFVLPYGGWKLHFNQWQDQKLFYGSDKTAWDWTVKEWMIELDLEFRQRLITTDDDWREQATKLYNNAFYDTRLILSNGDIYQQDYPGVMKSGCVNTISTNGHCQVMLHILYSIRKGISIMPLPKVVGDDTLQDEEHAVDVELYESFGVKIKSVSDTLEFLGRQWDSSGPRPMYLSKHLFAICYKKEQYVGEILDAYLREYVNTEEFEFWCKLVKELGFGGFVHSKSYYKFWMDNPMAKLVKDLC